MRAAPEWALSGAGGEPVRERIQTRMGRNRLAGSVRFSA